jgi:methionyl-tRNA synthetase
MSTQNHTEIDSQQKIFIGVSWPYASGNIHLGHVMGQYTVCDIFARYHRLRGNKVLMVSGSDAHGAPIILAAEKQHITPEELIAQSHEKIKETYRKLGFLYENYTSTHTENHKIVVQNIFKALEEFGYLKTAKSEQYYDTKVNRFLPDRYVKGTCPKCGATNARGDECPECGAYLSPEDLIDPYSTLSDSKPVKKETEHFYMDLSKTKDELLEFLKNKEYWREWVREFSKGFINEGLKPRAVTRDLNFGIPVPFDGWDNKVVYVWIEAVVGYLSAAIEWSEIQSKKGNTAPGEWESFWKDSNCKHYYFIAGGNAPFHTIIWPAELIAYNNKYKSSGTFEKYKLPNETSQKPLNLPYDVPANNLLLYQGKKMSKGDDSNIPLEALLEMFSPDLMRYFTTRFAPESHDRAFVWKDIIDLNNNELVANIGNFINRTVSFTNSKFDGIVPEGQLNADVAKAINKAFADVSNHLEHTEFVNAIEDLLELGHFANKYFNDEKPWERVKIPNSNSKILNSTEADETIYNCLQIVSAFRVLLKPFLPFAADRIVELLNVHDGYDANKDLKSTGFVSQSINTWKFAELKSGHKIGETKILFEKLEYTNDLKERDQPIGLETNKYDGVIIGQIKEKKAHPNSEKLGVYSVNIGKTTVQVLAGDKTLNIGDRIAYIPAGGNVPSNKKIKIEKKLIQGVESNGMLASEKELGVGKESKKVMKIISNAKPGDPFVPAKLITFTQDEKTKHIPVLTTTLYGVKVKKSSSEISAWVKEQEDEIKRIYSEPNWINSPLFSGYDMLHEKYGLKEEKASAPENLIALTLANGALPKVNNIVDIYNAISAKYGIAIGVHDIAKFDGQPKLEILKADQEFTIIGGKSNDLAKAGEYAYTDNKGIWCRLDIKQCDRTKVDDKTKDIFIVLQGNDYLGEVVLKQALDELMNTYNNFI